MTLKKFQHRQIPSEWSLDSLEKQIKGKTTVGD
jgi:hypothetical protein